MVKYVPKYKNDYTMLLHSTNTLSDRTTLGNNAQVGNYQCHLYGRWPSKYLCIGV